MRYLREFNTNSTSFQNRGSLILVRSHLQVIVTCRNVAYHSEPIGSLKLLNNGCIVDKGMLYHRFYPRKVNLIPAMEVLDRSFFRNLVDSLARYCNKDFLTKGGDEREVYHHIISKLSSEIPDFISKLAAVLDRPGDVIMLQHFKPVHTNALGVCCDHRIRRFIISSYLNAPRLLVFAVDGTDFSEMKTIPDNLYLPVEGGKFQYSHHVSSVCFTCYKSAEGFDYGDFYHPFTHGDERTDEHTYIYIKKLMPGTLHFYQLLEYSSYVPSVRYEEVEADLK
uniref:Uncharacterized protein n=1 Tax=Tetranychus urticae TaxID=32264 RepID=T1L503_TETUR